MFGASAQRQSKNVSFALPARPTLNKKPKIGLSVYLSGFFCGVKGQKKSKIARKRKGSICKLTYTHWYLPGLSGI